jgi:hypothetical protein
VAKAGFYAVGNRSFTFSNDHANTEISEGYTSGSNVLSVKAGTIGSFGAGRNTASNLPTDDYKKVAISALDPTIAMPVPGIGLDTQVGVEISFTDFLYDPGDNSGIRNIDKPN